MELLTSLGVNSSLAVQFVIFVVCYGLLKRMLFDPYFAAFDVRSARTVGTTELAEKFATETRELEKQFAARALEVNDRFRQAFEAARQDATREYDRIVAEARSRAKHVVDDTSARVKSEVDGAHAQIRADAAAVSSLISQKLVGKDVNA